VLLGTPNKADENSAPVGDSKPKDDAPF
jgi:hypothetical protein